MRSSASRAICALVVALVPIAGHADASAATSPALDVEVYPVEIGDPATAPTYFVADGGVWSVSDMGAEVHRVDPAAGPLIGFINTPAGPPMSRQLADGIFWSVVVDPNGEPCASPRPEEDADRPYVLRGVDVATGGTAARVPLGWCQWRPSRTLSGLMFVVAHEGTVWISRGVPSDPATGGGAETLRVDGSTGAIAAVDPRAAPLAAAADGRGVWGAGQSRSAQTASSAFGNFYGIPLARVDRDGSVVLPDAFPGGYWDPYTLEPDTRGVWFAGAKRTPRFGGLLDPSLTRITPAGRVTSVPGTHPWSVASDDDGHTWFLGTTQRIAKDTQPESVDWVLGRVDTRTGKQLRSYRLDLPADLGSLTTAHNLTLSLLGATGGAIWLRANSNTGPNTLLRVDEPTR